MINFGAKGSKKATGYPISDENKIRYFLTIYLTESKKQVMKHESKGKIDFNHNITEHIEITKHEIDTWMYEIDYSILRVLLNFVLLPFSAEILLQQDINFIVSMILLFTLI